MGETWIVQRTRLLAMVQRCADALRKYPEDGALATEALLLASSLQRELSVLNDAKSFLAQPLQQTVQRIRHGHNCETCRLYPPSSMGVVYDGTAEHDRMIMDLTKAQTDRASTAQGIVDDNSISSLYFNNSRVAKGDVFIRGYAQYYHLKQVLHRDHFLLDSEYLPATGINDDHDFREVS